MKTIIYKILVTSLVLFLLVAIPATSLAQDTTQVRSTTSMGGTWSSGGNYVTFGVAGQNAISTSLVTGSGYTGNIGFLNSPPPVQIENLVPVAISPTVEFIFELGNTIQLDGFDPEQQPIEFEITTDPKFGTLVSQDPVMNQEFTFEPSSDLEPDLIYRDTIKFKVNEQNTALESEIGVVAFQFSVQDQRHEIDTLEISGETFTLAIEDVLFNDSYTLDLNYYDLSNPTAPAIVNFKSGAISKSDLAIDGSIGSYAFDVSQTEHPYLFTADEALITVLVATENGFSAFESYIIENTSSGRAAASLDGKFFVVGSEMSVPENQSVLLKMIAVDFAETDVSESTFEWVTSPLKGSIGNVTAVEESSNLTIWEVEYTSVEDIGGNDLIEFKVFNPTRNEFQTGNVKIEIFDVNDLPTLNPISDQQMNEDGALDVNVIFSDPDNELNVFAESSEASNLTVSIANGVLTLTSLNDFSGQANINVWIEEVGTTEEYLRLQSFDVEVLAVNDPPVIQQVNDLAAEEDNSINVSLSATDPDTEFPVFTYSATLDDPSLASIEISGSLLKIVPFDNSFGTVNVSVTADDGSGAATSASSVMNFAAEFTPVNDAPSIVQQIESQVLVQDFPGYSIDLSAYFDDPETDVTALNYSVANNSSVNISFTNATANVTLAGGFSGVEDLDIIASDGVESVTMDVTFVVNANSPNLTVANAVSTINLTEDFGQYTLDVSSIFQDTNDAMAVFTYSIAGVSFLTGSVDDVTEEITFSSAQDYSGTESIVLIGSSGGTSTFTAFDIVTQAENDAPKLQTLANKSISEDGVLNDLVIAIEDVDSNVGDLSLAITSSDQGLVADGDISITKVNGFYLVDVTPIANANGVVTLNVVASDGSLQDAGSFDLELVSVNDLPSVVSSISDANEDAVKTIDVSTLFQDLDGDALTFQVDNLPTWLTKTGNVLSGTPTNEAVGPAQITVIAEDPGGEVRNTFSLNVINTNDAPILKQPVGTTTTLVGQVFSYAFPEGNFKEVDAGDDLTFTIENLPSWATNSNNTIVGTPTEADEGTYMITFRATDLDGASVTDVFAVTVQIVSYTATVTLSSNEVCPGGNSIVSASGAFDYNWYDENNQLLQAGGSTYESQPTATTKLFAAGVDGQGNLTVERFEVEVKVNPLPDVTITEGETLSVPSQSGTSYQWYFNDVAITGATNASYAPTAEGEYYVTATSGSGCETTSARVDFVNKPLGLDGPEVTFNMYPVPATIWLTLASNRNLDGYAFKIVGLDGKLTSITPVLDEDQIRFDVSSLRPGIYFLHISNDNIVETMKFSKK